MTISGGVGRVVAFAAVLALVAGGAFWVWLRWDSGRDERRIGAACVTWIEQRGDLGRAVDDAEEAAGRAADEGIGDLRQFLDDPDATVAALQAWLRIGPGVRAGLNAETATTVEREAVSAFVTAEIGLTDLLRLIRKGDPNDLLYWVDVVRAGVEHLDDTCEAAGVT